MDKKAIANLKKKIFSKIKKDDIHAIILFGSRARGDSNKDSDYDVNVYLKGNRKNLWKLRFEDLGDEFQVNVVDKKTFFKMKKDTHPFVTCAFRDGIPIYNNFKRSSRLRPD